MGGGDIGFKLDILKFTEDDHIQALKRTQVIETMQSQQMRPLMHRKRSHLRAEQSKWSA